MNKETLLEKYLRGEMPLHSVQEPLPTETELDASEEEFDRLMADRLETPDRNRRRIGLWAAAAVLLLGIILSIALYRPQSAPAPVPLPQTSLSQLAEETLAQQKVEEAGAKTEIQTARPKKAKARRRKVLTPQPKKQEETFYAATAADSLNYYLERLEREFAAIDDSINAADLGLLIKADVRLQGIVNRLSGRMFESAINVYHTKDSVSTQPIF